MSFIKAVTSNEVPLSTINGLHQSIIDIEARLSIPPLQSIDAKQISTPTLKRLLNNLPIPVKKARGALTCIGNVRLFRAAKAALAPDTSIPVLIHTKRLPRQQLEEDYLAELFYHPALAGLHTEDILRLFDVSKRMVAAKDLPDLGLGKKANFEKLFRLNSGRLRDK